MVGKKEGVALNTPTLVACGGVLVLAASKFKQKCYVYSDDEIRVINPIKNLYRKHLVVEEANDYFKLRPGDTLVESKREQALLKLQENYAVF